MAKNRRLSVGDSKHSKKGALHTVAQRQNSFDKSEIQIREGTRLSALLSQLETRPLTDVDKPFPETVNKSHERKHPILRF